MRYLLVPVENCLASGVHNSHSDGLYVDFSSSQRRTRLCAGCGLRGASSGKDKSRVSCQKLGLLEDHLKSRTKSDFRETKAAKETANTTISGHCNC